MAEGRDPLAHGARRDLSQTRFRCNNARKGSLVCAVLAFVALVVGAVFAEISTSGSPTTVETAVVRYVVLGALVAGVILYVIGGRMQREAGRG